MGFEILPFIVCLQYLAKETTTEDIDEEFNTFSETIRRTSFEKLFQQ